LLTLLFCDSQGIPQIDRQGLERRPGWKRHFSGKLRCAALAGRTAVCYLHDLESLGETKILIINKVGLRHYTHDKAISLMVLFEERYREGPVIVASQV